MSLNNGCNFYNKETELEIVKRYMSGESALKLCKIYGFKTQKSILDKVRKHGYDPKDANISEEKPYLAFSMNKIDSLTKAYILGVIMTDGNVNEEIGHFEINSTDEDLIKFISSYIGKDYKTYKPYKNSKARKEIHRIVFANKLLVKELERFGMKNNRSTTMDAPKLLAEEMKYLPYIFRGMIDGDGWIRKDGKEFYICSASEKMAEWMLSTLENCFYMQDLHLIKSEQDWNGRPSYIWYIRTAAERNIKILKTIIYDMPLGMARKYDILHQATNEPSENIMEGTCI